MVAIDFPAAPVLDDEFVAGGVTYVFNGVGWMVKGGGESGAHSVADTPPATPAQGDIWYESDTGILWLWYVDADSAQWVQVNGAPASVAPTVDAYTKAESDAKFVDAAGDSMTGALSTTGALHVNGANPEVVLNKTATTGQINSLVGRINNLARWQIMLGDTASEAGSNAGSNFTISRFDDFGVLLGEALLITRDTGFTAVTGLMSINAANGDGLTINHSSTAAHTARVTRLGSSAQYYDFFQCAGNTTGTIATDGTITAYNTTSDANLKEDLKSFDAGNIIDDTNVYDFKWRSTGTRSYGIIAQQAIEVYPQAVTHSTHPEFGEFWGIDYSKYVPVLLQELKALRTRVAQLEGRVSITPKVGG